MKLSTWFLFFLCVAMAGVGLYFYSFVYTPSVSALKDLEAENERLIAMHQPDIPSQGTKDTTSDHKVVYPTDKLFMPGTAQLSPEGEEILKELAKAFKSEGYSVITVACYSDTSKVVTNTDRFPTNWELSGARAATVVRYLISQGIPAASMAAVSYGPTRPVADNSTPEGRAQNRRVEIIAR